ncbi:hypothetical protein [Cupriavidus sp. RAF12]|uniref:hypothetical protein n=1 Tax=Cupriavidus sp. RAF12 TaxID=3233050 RepID=UPI003F936819
MNSENQRAPLAWGFVALFCAILGAGLLVPVYGDEVASVFMRGMFRDNGWRLNSLMPQCGPDFLLQVPWFHLPGALASEALYGATTPLGVRIRGLVIIFVWLGLTAMGIRGLFRARVLGTWILAGFVAVLGLGVLPLTLVMMRGEQMLLLLISVFLCFPIVAGRWAKVRDHGRLALLAAGFSLTASTFFYTHPKTLFFVPLVLLSALASFAGRSRIWCVAVSVFVLGCAWQTFQFAAIVTQCPDAPALKSLLSSNAMSLSGAISDPRAFVSEMIANIQAAPDAMLKHIWFANSYQSAWLAPVPGIAEWWGAVRVNEYIGNVVRSVYWVALWLPPLVILYQLVRRAPFRVLPWLCVLWIGLLAHLALFKTWNFYSASLVIPLAAWCIVLSLAAILDGRPIARFTRAGWMVAALLSPLLLLFLASTAILAFRVLPPTADSMRSADPGLLQQGLSIPTLSYPAQRLKIRDFARQCHVGGDGARHLVVDNLTFFAFDGLREPLQSDYLYEHGFGVDLQGDALPRLLKRLGSQAVIAQCTIFPGAFAGKVHREGNLCCVDLSSSP